MPANRSIQQNFTAGEISPRLLGRTDIEKYFHGASVLENFTVQAHGGITKRPGSIFVATTKSNGAARLVRFEFNTDQAYIIEFGNLYCRFYTDRGQIESGGSPYEIASPYGAAYLDDLQFAQSTDTLYIAHPSFKPRTLTRTGHAAWAFANYAPTADPFTSATNYPSAVTFFQQRLIFGGTQTAPSKIWATRSGLFNDMTAGTLDDDGYRYTLTSGSGRVPVIKWMAGANDLLIGTAGAEARATGGNYSAITPTNIDVREQTTNGCSKAQPIILNNSAIFQQRARRKLLNTAYALSRDGYDAGNITIMSDHITRGGINHLAYKAEPDPTVYSYRADGQLVGLTYEQDQGVIAWHRHIFGTAGVVESVASIPFDGGDELWLIVKYTIDGGTKRHIVVLHTEEWRDLEMDTSAEIKIAMKDCFYVDSGLSYDGSAATTISGLDHLIGETVSILADGAVVPNQVVNGSGQITLTTAASKVHVGLPYACRIVTVPLGDGGGKGDLAPFGNQVGWVEPRVMLHLSSEVVIGGESTVFRTADEIMGEPAPLYTGISYVSTLGYDDEGKIEISQNLPLPVSILAIGGRIDIAQ